WTHLRPKNSTFLYSSVKKKQLKVRSADHRRLVKFRCSFCRRLSLYSSHWLYNQSNLLHTSNVPSMKSLKRDKALKQLFCGCKTSTCFSHNLARHCNSTVSSELSK